ncbi:MAG: enolase, partial [Pseudomonas kermanshahensis]
MIITAVNVQVFSYPTRRAVDSAGHAHPGDVTQAKMALLRITTECGNEGYALGAPELIRPYVLDGFVRKVLVGANAFDREKIWHDLAHWQRGSASQLTDRALALVEQALWDWAGRKLNVPVHKLIGGYR